MSEKQRTTIVKWDNKYNSDFTDKAVKRGDVVRPIGNQQTVLYGLACSYEKLKAENERLVVFEKAILQIQKELYNDADSREWIKHLRKNVELKEEIAQLKADKEYKRFESLLLQNNNLTKENLQLKAERDEARRELCRAIDKYSPYLGVAKSVAKERSWDCFDNWQPKEQGDE